MEGYLGEVEVHKVRRVDCLVLPRNGQEFLKRDREESLSILRVETSVCEISRMPLLCKIFWARLSFGESLIGCVHHSRGTGYLILRKTRISIYDRFFSMDLFGILIAWF
jgi:hypothetical protein